MNKLNELRQAAKSLIESIDEFYEQNPEQLELGTQIYEETQNSSYYENLEQIRKILNELEDERN